MLIRIFTALMAFAMSIALSMPAAARRPGESYNDWLIRKRDEYEKQYEAQAPFGFWIMLGAGHFSSTVEAPSGDFASAAISRPVSGVLNLTNLEATLQPGEPTLGGLMTRTIWGEFKAQAKERVVIHTYGSELDEGSGEFDSVLAVYRFVDRNFANFTRIASNDNRPLAGFGAKSSLVQFDTVADANYAVQIGSRANAEGDISLNVSRLPPTGGLSAFLMRYDGSPFIGKDYSCEMTTTGTGVFCNPTFIVHNSTNKTLTVTPSTTLGAGVTGPAPFSLAPGALKVVTFTVTETAFNKTVRTVSGQFVFTGRTGSTVVTEARYRALVVVRPNILVEDLIKSVAVPTVQTGHIDEPIAFTSTITNRGPQTAIGCHFRSVLYSDLKTAFYRIDPATKKRLGADNVPLDIPAGQSRTFKVTIASQSVRDAYFIYPEVIPDCVNNNRRASPLRGGFDISTSGYPAPLPSLTVTASTPANGVLNVPRTGFAYYRFRVTNKNEAILTNALPAYENPYDDPANTDFTVAICRTNLATGACLAPYASSVSYQAAANQTVGFSVRVKAPPAAPAFDPDKRRVFVNFKIAVPPYFHIAAPSIAVRKQ